jgi:hypothetical protein
MARSHIKTHLPILLEYTASGFQKFPHHFGEFLVKDLRALQLEEGVLLQYTDDLLMVSSDCGKCLTPFWWEITWHAVDTKCHA